MPRSEIAFVIQDPSDGSSVPNAQISISYRGSKSSTPVSVYSTENGSSVYSQPIYSDSSGRVNGWLEEGSYDMSVSASGIVGFVQSLESVNGEHTVAAGGTYAKFISGNSGGGAPTIPPGIDGRFARDTSTRGMIWIDAVTEWQPILTYPRSPRIVAGIVNANATVNSGTGFTVSRTPGNSLGWYTVMFTVPFTGKIAVNAIWHGDGAESNVGVFLSPASLQPATGTGFSLSVVNSRISAYYNGMVSFTAVEL